MKTKSYINRLKAIKNLTCLFVILSLIIVKPIQVFAAAAACVDNVAFTKDGTGFVAGGCQLGVPKTDAATVAAIAKQTLIARQKCETKAAAECAKRAECTPGNFCKWQFQAPEPAPVITCAGNDLNIVVTRTYKCVCNKTRETTMSSNSNPTQFCSAGTIMLTATPNYTATGFQWFVGNTLIDNATSPTYAATSPGIYTVMVADQSGDSYLSNEMSVCCNCPTMGQWAMITFGILLLGIGIVYLRKVV